jgi:hypothetical protein
VVESHTVQALPDPLRRRAIAGVARMVGPAGTLIATARDDAARAEGAARMAEGPPWPLDRTEIEAFGADGLTLAQVDGTGLEVPWCLSAL